jgi:hypothetical protein
MLAQMAFASLAQSAAFDEGYSLTYGYAYLRTGDVRLSRGQNPPWTNILIALPLLVRGDIALPLDHPTWADGDIYGFSDEFLWKANPNPQQLILLARFPAMALALLLACVVYAFTRSLFGGRAAWAALFLCAFDPNILAHGHIAGTDLGVTVFLFASVWLWVSALKRNSLRLAIVAGLLGGAALASKYSAVWLVPSVLLIGLVFPVAMKTKATETRRHGEEISFGLRASVSLWLSSSLIARTLSLLAVFGIAAFFVIWATFGFSIGPVSPGGASLPAPDYWASLGDVRTRVESGTPAFMLGQISPTGFPLYYPFVFLVKTPLPTLLLMALGLIALIGRRDRATIAVWFPPALFMLAAMLNNLSLGYRLILPVLPFALMIAGRGIAVLWARVTTDDTDGTDKTTPSVQIRVHPWFRILVGGLAAWLVIDALTSAPNHIAYFNLLINRERDYEALVDSNLDWGQDLIALRDWLRAQNIDAINLSYFGTAHPEAYGIRANRLPGFALDDFGPEVDGFSAHALEPGWYVISATSLQLGLVYTHWDMYAPFRAREPYARVGRSILVYRVDHASAEIDRAVVLGPVTSGLDLDTLGGRPARRLIVKWAGHDAAVIDMQGRARYVTRGGEPLFGFAPDVRQALLTVADRLGNDASGNLRLFEIDARQALTAKIDSLLQSPVVAPDGESFTLPIAFESGLTLLGYDLAAAPSIDLVTYWQVYEQPALRLSIFAHVVDEAGNVLAQGDGLNVRLSSLEAGDIVMQHFVIDRPDGAVALRIGLYDPSTGQCVLAALPDGRRTDSVMILIR